MRVCAAGVQSLTASPGRLRRGSRSTARGAGAAPSTIVDIPKGRKALWNNGIAGVPTAVAIRDFVAAFLRDGAPTIGVTE